MYANLLYAAPGLKRSDRQLLQGRDLRGEARRRREAPSSPRGDVTIVRDQLRRAAHLRRRPAPGAMFGAGLRGRRGPPLLHRRPAARRACASSRRSRAAPTSPWTSPSGRTLPTTRPTCESSTTARRPCTGTGACRSSATSRTTSPGINQFIAEACVNPTRMPGEYDLIGQTRASACRAIRGRSTDVHLDRLAGRRDLRQGRRRRARATRSCSRLSRRVRRQAGPEGLRRLPLRERPRGADDRPRQELPRTGSRPSTPAASRCRTRARVQFADAVQRRAARGRARPRRRVSRQACRDGGSRPAGAPARSTRDASNALLVSGRETKGGHPRRRVRAAGLLLLAADPDGGGHPRPGSRAAPAIDARGAAFPGTNLYVQLGHGRNYAWSATSASQDIIDTYAVKLCNPGGGKPTLDLDHYELRGQVPPFEVLTRNDLLGPDLGRPDAARLADADLLRTKVGIVDRAGDYRRQALRLHPAPRHLLPRGRPVDARVLALQRPEAHADAGRLLPLRLQHLLHLQLVLHQPQPHRLLQLRPEPAAPEGRRPQPARPRQAASYLWKSFDPSQPHRARGPAPPADPEPPPRHRPALPDELEQPAGARLQRRASSTIFRVPQPCAGRATSSRTSRGPRRIKPPAADLGDMEDAGTVDDRGRPRPTLDLQGDPATPITHPGWHAFNTSRAWVQVRLPPHRSQRDGVYDDSEARSGSWTPGGRTWCRPSSSPRSASRLTAPSSRARLDDPDRNRSPRLGLRHELRTDSSRRTFAPAGPACPWSLLARLLRRRQAPQVPECAARLARRRAGTRATPRSIRRAAARLFGNISGRRRPARTRSTSAPSARSPSREMPWVNRPTFQQAVEIK